jgi:nitrous oxidase accessory protein NosD
VWVFNRKSKSNSKGTLFLVLLSCLINFLQGEDDKTNAIHTLITQRNVTVIGTTIRNCSVGIQINDPLVKVRLEKNTISQCTGNAIYIHHAAHLLVCDNDISESYHGIGFAEDTGLKYVRSLLKFLRKS